jgi:hypothetical protein
MPSRDSKPYTIDAVVVSLAENSLPILFCCSFAPWSSIQFQDLFFPDLFRIVKEIEMDLLSGRDNASIGPRLDL